MSSARSYFPRGVRIAAQTIAVISLAAFGWTTWRPIEVPLSGETEVVLWSAGSSGSMPDIGRTHYALADATNAPASATRIGDTAFLRRQYPRLERVHLVGGGLAPADAAALAGVEVVWHRTSAEVAEPVIAAFAAPPRLRLGEQPVIQGRIRGLRGPATASLSVEGPDGATHALEIRTLEKPDAPFSLTANPPAATGRNEWTLRLGNQGSAFVFGIEVVDPELPRVLLVLESPATETARLQRWLADTRSPMTSRTRVSAEHVRYTSANGAPTEVPTLDAAAWDGFDVVLLSETALSELTATERRSLDEAIRLEGLGLLVIGAASAASPSAPLAPWTTPVRDPSIDEQRRARIRLTDGTEIDEPVAIVADALPPLPLARWLVRDSRGRWLAAARRHGHGWVARSLITETWRWFQGGYAPMYAAYWSALLSSIARAAEPPAGRWTLADGGTLTEVNEAVRLIWTGPHDAVPASVDVAHLETGQRTALPVGADRDEPTSARAIFWPDQAGWHTIHSPGAPAPMASFHVQPRRSLPAVDTERRRLATEQLIAVGNTTERGAGPTVSHRSTLSLIAAIALGVFVLAGAVLWIDQRLAGQRAHR